MENKELELAWKIISSTDTHLFLTGKAGTGKTTFLRELRNRLPKRMIVVAPTGIAAINAEGVTIHSFFQLTFGPQIPGMQQSSKKYAFRRNKLRIIRTVDLIVIDEISMVRADLLDAIDRVLRQYRDKNRPFGGVQMLFIGDMQQLAPVARDDEWQLLRPYYDTPYFFSSKALLQSQFVTVELKHVYRQNDPVFINLLNKVRTNTMDDEALALLNSRYVPRFSPKKSDGYIRLTTHNFQADEINQRELAAINNPSFTFSAKLDGEFPELSYPTDKDLTLKLGAQVMFVKNDSNPAKRYFNGMIGEVVEIDHNKIVVLPTDADEAIEVTSEKWQNMKYELNEETKEIIEKEVGSFVQFPLKTAWAITVHKSQGLTFKHAIIDVQHSFAHGQTYVALSRCKSLEGMVLSAPVPRHAIITDNTVEVFTKDPRHKSPDQKHLDELHRQYYLRLVGELFGFSETYAHYDEMIHFMREYFYDKYNAAYNAWCVDFERFKKEIYQVSLTFHKQYSYMIMTDEEYMKSEPLQERIKKGAGYFEEKMADLFLLIKKTKIETKNKELKQRLNRILETITNSVRVRILILHNVSSEGFSIESYLKLKAKTILKVETQI